MSIVRANACDFEAVKHITVQTIKSIYPHYYPVGAVNFFLNHHNDTNIEKDIKKEIVYLCLNENNEAVGTVTVNKNEIGRLFVLPECQGNGYGRELLDFSENKISEKYDSIILSASLPAKSIYIRRGYKETEFNLINTDNGDYLCYDLMVKKI